MSVPNPNAPPMPSSAPVGPVESRSSAGEPMKRFARFVGLDVHKKTVVACVLDADGRKVHGETCQSVCHVRSTRYEYWHCRIPQQYGRPD